METLSPNTNPVGDGTKNFSMNAPVEFFNLIGREACARMVSSKQYIVENLLRGIAIEDPAFAGELRDKLVAHRARAVSATMDGARAFREAAKVTLCIAASLFIVHNCFTGSTELRRSSTKVSVRTVRRNSKSEEVTLCA